MHTQLSTNTTHLHDSALHVLLEKISQQIGAQKVTRPSPDRLTPFDTDRNVSQFRSRAAPARIGPATVAEVQTVARLFSEQAAPATLYPISTGRNWGLGSFLPAHSGSVALDLRALSAIRHIDLQGGWAEVEPGVTQLVLSKELAVT